MCSDQFVFLLPGGRNFSEENPYYAAIELNGGENRCTDNSGENEYAYADTQFEFTSLSKRQTKAAARKSTDTGIDRSSTQEAHANHSVPSRVAVSDQDDHSVGYAVPQVFGDEYDVPLSPSGENRTIEEEEVIHFSFPSFSGTSIFSFTTEALFKA